MEKKKKKKKKKATFILYNIDEIHDIVRMTLSGFGPAIVANGTT